MLQTNKKDEYSVFNNPVLKEVDHLDLVEEIMKKHKNLKKQLLNNNQTDKLKKEANQSTSNDNNTNN